MQLNKQAEKKAGALIDARQYVKDSDWSQAQPGTEAENDFLDRHDWEAFAEWHLGIHQEKSEATKGRFGFPYGDFRRVHRAGLVAVKQRAAQQGYDDIEAAADQLLARLDANG